MSYYSLVVHFIGNHSRKGEREDRNNQFTDYKTVYNILCTWERSSKWIVTIAKDGVDLFFPRDGYDIPEEEPTQFGAIYPSTQHLNETTPMAAKTAFEYTVILHALPSKDNAGNDTTPDSKIIIGPTTVVAVDANHVTRIASRGIDSKAVSDSDLGRVEIKVRNL